MRVPMDTIVVSTEEIKKGDGREQTDTMGRNSKSMTRTVEPSTHRVRRGFVVGCSDCDRDHLLCRYLLHIITQTICQYNITEN